MAGTCLMWSWVCSKLERVQLLIPYTLGFGKLVTILGWCGFGFSDRTVARHLIGGGDFVLSDWYHSEKRRNQTPASNLIVRDEACF